VSLGDRARHASRCPSRYVINQSKYPILLYHLPRDFLRSGKLLDILDTHTEKKKERDIYIYRDREVMFTRFYFVHDFTLILN